jgi:hypothetical protein
MAELSHYQRLHINSIPKEARKHITSYLQPRRTVDDAVERPNDHHTFNLVDTRRMIQQRRVLGPNNRITQSLQGAMPHLIKKHEEFSALRNRWLWAGDEVNVNMEVNPNI